VPSDIAAADTRELRAQVCVVGGGAAGIIVATELARNDVSVILLEGGGRRFEERSQELFRSDPDPRRRHDPLGGTSAALQDRLHREVVGARKRLAAHTRQAAAVPEASRDDPGPHLSSEIRRCFHALSRPKGTG
jgi:choline dehydrogenase-like flavoprotein